MLRKSETETKLDAEIRTALAKLDGLEPTSEEYAKTVDMTRTVQVRAVTREVAEKRALKFNRNAKGVKRNA